MENKPQEVSRRKAIKLLMAATGAMTLTNLPSKWVKPALQVGVLPAHAQTSPTATATTAPTPTNTPTPTGTPVLYIITTCSISNLQQSPIISPSDTLQGFADILPGDADISIRCTISLNETGHPQDGEVRVTEGVTDASGRYQMPNFDLTTLSPPISPGVDRVEVRWEFVNANEGTGVCVNLVEIIANPPTN